MTYCTACVNVDMEAKFPLNLSKLAKKITRIIPDKYNDVAKILEDNIKVGAKVHVSMSSTDCGGIRNPLSATGFLNVDVNIPLYESPPVGLWKFVLDSTSNFQGEVSAKNSDAVMDISGAATLTGKLANPVTNEPSKYAKSVSIPLFKNQLNLSEL